MKFIIASVVLFSFVHPGSKIILESGLPLSFFCTLFVGLRVLAVIPFFIYKKTLPIPQKKDFTVMLIFGLIGASLQFFEFKGIAEGLSPGLVTFLMFSYPLWLYLVKVFKDKKVGLVKSFQFCLLLAGLFSLTGGSFKEMQTYVVVYPVLASLAIAVWILLSNHLTKKGIEPVSLSFYYDLFSLLALVVLFGKDFSLDMPKLAIWFSGQGVMSIVLYSLLIGLAPNLLFYYGSKKVTSESAGGAMTFEPVISTFYSFVIWGAALSNGFWLGSVLIFIGNLPLGSIFEKMKEKEFKNGNILSTS